MAFFGATSWGVEDRTPTLARCGQCGLAKRCYSPRMQPTGRGERKVLFVGEAPGEQEDKRGVQLIGDSGQLLRRVLRGLACDLDDCWKTNAVICRPPGNKIEPMYVEACRPNLLKTIRELRPSVIVLLGSSAVDSLIGTEWKRDIGPIGRWVGWQIPSMQYGAWLCPTYHPSYILRTKDDPVLMRMLKAHLRAALDLERQGPPSVPTLEDYRQQVEVITSTRLGRVRMRELAAMEKGRVVFDYECTGLKPDHPDQRIVSVGFCANGGGAFACPVDDDSLPVLSRVLRNPGLIKDGCHIKFEERWTRAKLGHGVRPWGWCTMLGAHWLDNRQGITSAKFQAYVRLGVGDYEGKVHPYLQAEGPNAINRIDEVPLDELLMYNGLDALLEDRVARLQRREACYGFGHERVPA